MKELKSFRILDADLQPCSYHFLNASFHTDLVRNAYTEGNPPYNVYCKVSDFKEKLKNYRDQLTQGKNEEITINYFELLKTAAAYYAGIQAIEYCQNFLKIQ